MGGHWRDDALERLTGWTASAPSRVVRRSLISRFARIPQAEMPLAKALLPAATRRSATSWGLVALGHFPWSVVIPPAMARLMLPPSRRLARWSFPRTRRTAWSLSLYVWPNWEHKPAFDVALVRAVNHVAVDGGICTSAPTRHHCTNAPASAVMDLCCDRPAMP